jgi:hypothetical protein
LPLRSWFVRVVLRKEDDHGRIGTAVLPRGPGAFGPAVLRRAAASRVGICAGSGEVRSRCVDARPPAQVVREHNARLVAAGHQSVRGEDYELAAAVGLEGVRAEPEGGRHPGRRRLGLLL